jgi:hypothetical protein
MIAQGNPESFRGALGILAHAILPLTVKPCEA